MRHKCWQNNVSPFRPNGVSTERAKQRPENSPPRKKKKLVAELELNPGKIGAIPPSNYGNGIPYLTILSALLNGNSLSRKKCSSNYGNCITSYTVQFLAQI